MKNIRWVNTVAYTLYDENGNEFLFDYIEGYDESGSPLTFRETEYGVEFTKENGVKVLVDYDDIKSELE